MFSIERELRDCVPPAWTKLLKVSPGLSLELKKLISQGLTDDLTEANRHLKRHVAHQVIISTVMPACRPLFPGPSAQVLGSHLGPYSSHFIPCQFL